MAIKIAIIGAGPGGYIAAVRASQLGADVTVIESAEAGGTCLHWGCIPSKVMKTTADLFESLQQASELGIDMAAPARLNVSQLMARKRSVIATQVKGIRTLLHKHHVQFLNGLASIEAPNRLSAQLPDKTQVPVQWDRLIIATGTHPKALPFAPFDGKQILSSDHILELKSIPESITIIGGGVIGCEFAFILSALGSQVTVIEEMPRLLPIPSVDEDCSKIIQREMKKRKISIHPNHRAKKIEIIGHRVHIDLEPVESSAAHPTPEKQSVQSNQVLVCIGRVPSNFDLGLDKISVKRDPNGWIVTDNCMATNVPGVYAIGDILGPEKIMLAHAASAEGIVAAENAMGHPRKMAYDLVPSAIFTMPEVASVGLTEAQALGLGKEVKSHRFLFRQLGKAHVIGKIAGEVKMIAEKTTGRLLGVHIVGPHATDLISEATVALKAGYTVQQLAETIHPHPTLSEALMETALQAFQESV